MAAKQNPPIPIRVDPQLWQQVRETAGNRKGSEAVNEAMRMWLAQNAKAQSVSK